MPLKTSQRFGSPQRPQTGSGSHGDLSRRAVERLSSLPCAPELRPAAHSHRTSVDRPEPRATGRAAGRGFVPKFIQSPRHKRACRGYMSSLRTCLPDDNIAPLRMKWGGFFERGSRRQSHHPHVAAPTHSVSKNARCPSLEMNALLSCRCAPPGKAFALPCP